MSLATRIGPHPDRTDRWKWELLVDGRVEDDGVCMTQAAAQHAAQMAWKDYEDTETDPDLTPLLEEDAK